VNEPTSRLGQLDRQRADGFWRLRFHPDLEAEFRVDHADSIVPRRLALLTTAFLLIAIAPLLEAWVLHPPAGFVPYSRIAEFGAMMPSIAVAALFTLWRPLRPWANLVTVLAIWIVCAGVIYQRHVGAAYGYTVPSELIATYYVIQAQTMLGMIAMLGAGMEEYAARSAWLQRKMLEELTLRDPLTGLVNARGLRDVYRRLFSTAMREHRPMLVVAVDIDHFKPYNDHYGHLAGDDALRRVANTLSRHGRRGNDISARTGGEEFVLVWYDVLPENAPRLLEALRQDIEHLGILHSGVPHRPSVLTVSIGAVCAVPGPRVAPEALLQSADDQLYRSKQRGRNCVSLHVAGAPADPASPQPRVTLPS
jgi:diguanylate cyclase (GGDEF)-like protein